MTSRRFFHELSFKILLSEKEKKIPFSKRKSIIRDHLCCLHGACPTSPQSATPSETELNGGCHHVWSEGCRDACQRPRLSHNPIVLTGFFFLTFYGIVHGESEKTVKQVAWWIFTNQTHRVTNIKKTEHSQHPRNPSPIPLEYLPYPTPWRLTYNTTD